MSPQKIFQAATPQYNKIGAITVEKPFHLSADSFHFVIFLLLSRPI